MGDVTEILKRWHGGDEAARNALFDTVYADLRKRANGMLLKQGPRKALQPTELVSESFLKLAPLAEIKWQDRNHFLAVASTIMRQVLGDIYRQANAQKRAKEQVTLITEHLASSAQPLEFEELENSLVALAEIDEQLVTVVELKFFAGMTTNEIALVLEQSESTIKRNWRAARAWLLDRMADTNQLKPADP